MDERPASEGCDGTVDVLRIDRVVLRNFRCFAELRLDLDPGLTVIAARNGAGKTAVLDAIAVALGPFVGGFDTARGVHFAASDCRQVPSRTGGLVEAEPQFPVQVAVKGSVDNRRVEWRRELASAKSHTTYADSRELIAFAKRLQSGVRASASSGDPGPLLPLVSYYGTGRLWDHKRVPAGPETNGRSSRTVGYADCLDSSSRYRTFVRWFERLTRAEFDERDHPEVLGGIRNQLQAVRSAVDTVLEPCGWRSIAFKSREAGVVVEHDRFGVLPVDLLSDGIRNLIGLAADIAHRGVRLNSHLGVNAVRLTPGIVLIDEIDMHLHPAWQQTVIATFRRAFPAIQFVVTTHSPQVLTTVRQHHIRLLDCDGGVYVPTDTGTYGAESSRVLEEILGVHARPQSVETVAQLRAYLSLVEDGKARTGEARDLRHKLEYALGTKDPDLRLADLRAVQLEALKRT
jgi:predicted ATP-binding protein involved in virulence